MLKLVSMDADIVCGAEYAVTLKDNTARVRAHVSKVGGGTLGRAYAGTWEYAVLLRAVGGWGVIASGTDIETRVPQTHGQVGAMIAEQYGDGFHYLPLDRYGVIGKGSTVVHIRRDTPARVGAYCGMSLTVPYAPGVGRAAWHCATCTDVYRAENWGRCPVEGP